MADYSPEAKLRHAQFASALVWIRHCVETVNDEDQAERFYRDLEEQCTRLVPKFRKGNALSQLLAKNRLSKKTVPVVHSATES